MPCSVYKGKLYILLLYNSTSLWEISKGGGVNQCKLLLLLRYLSVWCTVPCGTDFGWNKETVFVLLPELVQLTCTAGFAPPFVTLPCFPKPYLMFKLSLLSQ